MQTGTLLSSRKGASNGDTAARGSQGAHNAHRDPALQQRSTTIGIAAARGSPGAQCKQGPPRGA
eukprot:7278164-Heterocapsa_arctica.AAC.1